VGNHNSPFIFSISIAPSLERVDSEELRAVGSTSILTRRRGFPRSLFARGLARRTALSPNCVHFTRKWRRVVVEVKEARYLSGIRIWRPRPPDFLQRTTRVPGVCRRRKHFLSLEQ